MIRTVLSVIALAGLVLVTVAACGTPPEVVVEPESTATPAPTAQPTPPDAGEVDPCSLLSDDDAEAVAGEPMTDRAVADVGGLPACQMSGDSRGIQVVQVPANVWAKTLPALIEQVQAAGGFGEENDARLEDAAARIEAGDYDGLDACEFFSTLTELNGTPPGQSRTVAYVPDGLAPQAISAQSCVNGTYTSLMLVGADIAVDADTETAIEAALDLLEKD